MKYRILAFIWCMELIVALTQVSLLASQTAPPAPAPKNQRSQASVVTDSQRQLARTQFQEAVMYLMRDGDLEKAHKGFLRAVLLDPNFAAPYYNLGILAEAKGNWPRAAHWFQGYLRVDPDSKLAPRVKAELAHIAEVQKLQATPAGRTQSAYDDAIARARVYLNAGMLKPAIATAADAAKTDPKRWEAYAIAASALSQDGRAGDAENFLSMAIERAPMSKKAALNKALAALKTKQQNGTSAHAPAAMH